MAQRSFNRESLVICVTKEYPLMRGFEIKLRRTIASSFQAINSRYFVIVENSPVCSSFATRGGSSFFFIVFKITIVIGRFET